MFLWKVKHLEIDLSCFLASLFLAPLTAASITVFISEFNNEFPITKVSSMVLLLLSGLINLALIATTCKNNKLTDSRGLRFASFGSLSVSAFPLLAIYSAMNNTWAQRFNLLFNSSEDTAAWVSLARAIVMNQNLPHQISESEYFIYGTGSVAPGAITYIAAYEQGATDLYSAITTSVNIVFANYAILAFSGIGLSLIFLSNAYRSLDFMRIKQNFVPMFLIGFSSTLLITSALSVAPILQGSFLGFATVMCIVAFLIYFLMDIINHKSLISFSFISFWVSILVSAAISIWPFITIFTGLLAFASLALRSTGLKNRSILFAAIMVPTLLIGKKYLTEISNVASIDQLAKAAGQLANVDATFMIVTTLLFVTMTLFISELGRHLNLEFNIIHIISVAMTSLVLIYLGSRFLGLVANYGIYKFRYMVFAIALIPLALSLLWITARIQLASLVSVPAIFLIFLSTTSGTLTSVVDLPSYLGSGGDGLPGSSIRQLATIDNATENWSCLPDPDITPPRNYICNRWASALSAQNGKLDFEYRAAILNTIDDYDATVDAFTKNGYLARGKLILASEIIGK